MIKIKNNIAASVFGPFSAGEEVGENTRRKIPKAFQQHLVDIGSAEFIENKALMSAPENKKKGQPNNKHGSASQQGRASTKRTSKKLNNPA